MSRCRRTPGLIDRLVAGRVTDEDRAHAASCGSCGPVLARAAAFDEDLRSSARGLVADELPRGILDQAIDGRAAGVVSRRAAPSFAAILATVAILLTATVIALAPGGGPEPSPSTGPSSSPLPSPSPTSTGKPFVERFKSTAAIVGQLGKLGYACNDGAPLESIGPGPDAVIKDAAVCAAPDTAGPYVLVVIVGEAANGKVVELGMNGDGGGDTTENRTLLALGVAKVFALALLDEGAGQNGGSWAKVHVAELERRQDAEVVLRDVSFEASRLANGSWHIVVRGAPAT
jgi:hypothetical protein